MKYWNQVLDGALASGNVAQRNGGMMYASDVSSMLVAGSSAVSGNSAGASGGAIFANGSIIGEHQ